MARFHFVEDYERLVASLIRDYPLGEAMSRAVGGNYNEIGAIERDLLVYAGLKNGMSLVDFGCGSGRLGHALGSSLDISYVGIDIVQDLLDYAKTKCPPHYKFIVNRELRIPGEDNSADFITAFSVFTHLLHSESFVYMQDIKRVLKPGGRLVFSFLEFADKNHWEQFTWTVEAPTAPINSFIERHVIDVWSEKLGYVRETFIGGAESPWGTEALGQATAILRKPQAKEAHYRKRASTFLK